ncbi:MAG: DUF1499 domain-containing protein [Gemmatimonadetes bacterium]|nr:DUF1499 domain-containing protein [Gemmatimonadota bacterium]
MNGGERSPTTGRISWLALAALALAVAALVAAAAAGPGSRWDAWDFRTGFTVLRWSAIAGLGAAVVGLAGLGHTRPGGTYRGFSVALMAVLLGLGTFAVPYMVSRQAASAPPIHDISTDLDDPPRFEAVLPLRADAPNPPEHGGPEVAAQQAEAYPDIQPMPLDVAPAEAFDRALEAARAQGWEIVAADPEAGRIEATATTFWFGFEDDVVVRVRPADTGSVVDVRSVSRVGRGDAGKNADRIREYLDALQE